MTCDPDCRHYTCGGCGRDVCPEREVSPGEPDLCAGCWEMEAAS